MGKIHPGTLAWFLWKHDGEFWTRMAEVLAYWPQRYLVFSFSQIAFPMEPSVILIFIFQFQHPPFLLSEGVTKQK